MMEVVKQTPQDLNLGSGTSQASGPSSNTGGKPMGGHHPAVSESVSHVQLKRFESILSHRLL